MSHNFTESELRGIASRLEAILTDSDGLMAKAKRHLADGELESARLTLAKAIRKQIKIVKKYDTTGRMSSQIQELVHTRKRLLKGTTWSSCRKVFARGWEIFGKIGQDLDVKIVKYVGHAVGVGVWICQSFLGMGGDIANTIDASGKWARRLYRPIKATIKTLVDPKGRHHFCDMCKGAYEVARERAEAVWSETKKIARQVGTVTKQAAVSGYRLARTASHAVAETVRAAGYAVAEAASRTFSTIGNVASSVAHTIGSSVRSGWATVKSWFS